MKKLLLIPIGLLLTVAAFAQDAMNGSAARIGIKAGVNLSRMHYSDFSSADMLNDLTKDRVGYNFTVFGDFGVGKNFFIQPGISLQNKGTKLEGSVVPGSGANFAGVATVDVMAIEIPVNAVLRIPTGDSGAFQISAGPYISFNVSGKGKTKVTSGTNAGQETETDLDFGRESADNLSSTDFGANFGLAYRLKNGINFGGNYGLGLSNLVPEANRSTGGKAVNRILGFSVGYSF